MCGIYGYINTKKDVDKKNLRSTIKNLFDLSESRGKEAAGIAISTENKISIYKDSVSASEMQKSKEYKLFLDETMNFKESVAILGHARLVTNGFQAINANNQPVCKHNMIIIHNGIIVNDNELWEKYSSMHRNANVDTEVIPSLINYFLESGSSLVDSLVKTFHEIKGEVSIGMLFSNSNIMVLYSNTGSLFTVQDEAAFAFLSEKAMLENVFFDQKYHLLDIQKQQIQQVKPNEMWIIDLKTLKKDVINVIEPKNINITLSCNSLKKTEDRYEKAEERKKNLRRCTRCILPETMPFIEFDINGVCNYCHAHKPTKLLGKEKLEQDLLKYRSKDGSADCIVAFSGGRDSSYGLHLLKKEYGMNPIAYTYDWGMVTDIARRNQAKMCGQLGIEHIWVSADIKQKRENVRKNLEAWLKQPDLGMIPLLMAGDKQFFWYANKLMKQTNMQTMIFCMNDYERTDFKSGFANVKPSILNDKIYEVPLASKIKIAQYYGSQFLSNPSYLNSSIFDTAWAYLSWYFVQHEYLHPFNYIHWDENELNNVLLNEYEWEIAKDTNTTWRIGDGTAPFYNYVYNTVAGFSENDAFRSNQIRAGVLSRDDALMLSADENKPRWDSIREYLSVLNISFDDTMKIIDRMKKLY